MLRGQRRVFCTDPMVVCSQAVVNDVAKLAIKNIMDLWAVIIEKQIMFLRKRGTLLCGRNIPLGVTLHACPKTIEAAAQKSAKITIYHPETES